MHSNKFEGMWEDLALKHAQALRGHRVEIRVLDGASEDVPTENWAAFEARVAEISKGWRIPSGHMYSAADFYESRDWCARIGGSATSKPGGTTGATLARAVCEVRQRRWPTRTIRECSTA